MGVSRTDLLDMSDPSDWLKRMMSELKPLRGKSISYGLTKEHRLCQALSATIVHTRGRRGNIWLLEILQ